MRKIDEIILHCTATPEGRDHSIDEVRAWHKQRGFSDIGYHYLITLDGTVQAGRPLEVVGAHCRGHNAHSIGVCYVGGVAADGHTPKDTRTAAQRTALVALLLKLLMRFRAARVVGHNELSPKACPSFDVRDFVRGELFAQYLRRE